MASDQPEELIDRILRNINKKDCTRLVLSGFDIELFDRILEYVGLFKEGPEKAVELKDGFCLDYYFRVFLRRDILKSNSKKFTKTLTKIDEDFSFTKQRRLGIDKKVTQDQAEAFICCAAFVKGETLRECLAAFLHYCEIEEKIDIPFINNNKDLKKAKDKLIFDHLERLSGAKPRKSLQIICENKNFKISESLGDLSAEELRLPRRSNPSIQDVSTLLRWEYHLTDFVGREHELKRLRSWLETDDPFSVMLIHGDGGAGKTRLAFHFAEDIYGNEWRGGQTGTDLIGKWISGDDGILIVIDYPEEKRALVYDFLKAFQRDCRDSISFKIRVVLTSRNNEFLKETIKDAAGFKVNTLALQGLDNLTDQQALFIQSWRRLASLKTNSKSKTENERQKEPSQELINGFGEWLEGKPEHSAPIMIIALAIYLIDSNQTSPATISGIKAAEIFRYLSIREERRIRDEIKSIVSEGGIEQSHLEPESVLLIRAIAAIFDGISDYVYRSIYSFLPDENIDFPLARKAYINKLSFVKDGAILPIKPDLLAADFLVYSLNKWAKNQESIWLMTAIGVDSTNARNFEKRELIAAVINERFDRLNRIYYDATSILNIDWPITPIFRFLESNLFISWWLAYCLRSQVSSTYTDVVLIHSIRLTLSGKDSDMRPQSKAGYRLKLANCLKHKGELTEAYSLLLEASEIYAQLIEENQIEWGLEYSECMSHIAMLLSDLGLKKDSLEAISKAVSVMDILNQNGIAFDSYAYADNLLEYSIALADNGDISKSLKINSDAIELYHKLHQAAECDRSRYGLATSFFNYTNRLVENRRIDEAFHAMARARTEIEYLYQVKPEVYENDRARFLLLESGLLYDAGNIDAAAGLAIKAKIVLKKMSEQNFLIYGREYALCLTIISAYFQEIEDTTKSIETVSEAIKVYQLLSERSPELYFSKVIYYLNDLSVLLLENKSFVESLKYSIEIIYLLSKQSNTGFNYDSVDLGKLYTALFQRILYLIDIESYELRETLDLTVNEKVEIFNHLEILAFSLDEFAECLLSIKRISEYTDAIDGSIIINDFLSKKDFSRYGERLMFQLNNISAYYANQGSAEKSYGLLKRAITLCEANLEKDFDWLEKAYGTSLYLHCIYYDIELPIINKLSEIYFKHAHQDTELKGWLMYFIDTVKKIHEDLEGSDNIELKNILSNIIKNSQSEK